MPRNLKEDVTEKERSYYGEKGNIGTANQCMTNETPDPVQRLQWKLNEMENTIAKLNEVINEQGKELLNLYRRVCS